LLHELDPQDFPRARPLFQPLAAFQPFCGAVLAGVHPGRVFVDDPASPQTGFVSREDPWCFLAGDPADGAFNRALNEAIYTRQAVPEKVPSLLFTCRPGDWGGRLAEVMAPRQPIPGRRRRYVGRAAPEGHQAAPEGYRVERLDPALLDQRGLALPGEVRETLERWRVVDHPDLQDFGFVALHDDEIAAWATVDAVVDGLGDAGLFTLPAHRQRGLATAVAAAALAHARAHGLEVNWTCAEDNAGSIRVAEKLGFARGDDYWLYMLCFDEAEHLGGLAYTHLRAGRHREAVDLLEQSFGLAVEPPAWAYYDAATAWAALGQPERALARLAAAVERGYRGFEDDDAFTSLHGLPGWAALLARGQRTGGESW
jgi:RimJ/RimL family protein N-acetyltransferase